MPHRNSISPLVQKRLKEMDLFADDVLRKALNVKAEGLMTSEGVFFPEGTKFISFYKDGGKDGMYTGTVKDGVIVMKHTGNSFTAVSGAAADVTGRAQTNGWAFWLVKLPGKNEVVPIASLRKQ